MRTNHINRLARHAWRLPNGPEPSTSRNLDFFVHADTPGYPHLFFYSFGLSICMDHLKPLVPDCMEISDTWPGIGHELTINTVLTLTSSESKASMGTAWRAVFGMVNTDIVDSFMAKSAEFLRYSALFRPGESRRRTSARRINFTAAVTVETSSPFCSAGMLADFMQRTERTTGKCAGWGSRSYGDRFFFLTGGGQHQ